MYGLVVLSTLIVAAACGGGSPQAEALRRTTSIVAIERHDLRIAGAPGITLAVRAVIPATGDGPPVVLVHGAGGGGIASFDLPVPGYSLAEDLARAGHAVYAIDIRGWGQSTRPAALAVEPEGARPAVQSSDAVADLGAVVDAVRARHGGARVALVGWATGGHWVGMYAAAHPASVARLAMINALYGVAAPWSLQSALEERPGQLAAMGAYRRRNASGLIGRWDASIPIADRDAWRDPRVVQAYVDAAIGSDPEAAHTDPPSVRVPSGPLHDSYLLATGTKLWSAAQLRCPILMIRSELDFWSRPDDVRALRADLPPGVAFESLEIPQATHFVHLDRPEHGRAALVTGLRNFLGAR